MISPAQRETLEVILAAVHRLGLVVVSVDPKRGTVTVTAPTARSVK